MQNEEKNEILKAIADLNSNINNKIINLENEIKIIKEQVAKIPKIEEQVAKIPKIEEQVAKISWIEEQATKIPTIEERLEKIENQVSEIPVIKEDIRKLQKSVAVIELEHGNKIQALLDIASVHSEKFEINEKEFKIIRKKLEKHDDEIYWLKSKAQG